MRIHGRVYNGREPAGGLRPHYIGRNITAEIPLANALEYHFRVFLNMHNRAGRLREVCIMERYFSKIADKIYHS